MILKVKAGGQPRGDLGMVLAVAVAVFCVAGLGFVASAGAETAGTLSFFAGTGTASKPEPADPCGSAQPSCSATSADLGGTGAIATDSAGDVFVPDEGNDLVEEIAPSGELSFVAGNFSNGLAKDGPEVPATCTSDAQACPAVGTYGFDDPDAVALDGSDLYIADSGDDLVDEVDLTTGHIWRVAGGQSGGTITGSGPCGSTGTAPVVVTQSCSAVNASLDAPGGLAVDDSTGDVYISDQVNDTVDQVAPSGELSIFAGDATSTSPPCVTASMPTCPATSVSNGLEPSGVGIGQSTGDVYVSDYATQQILQVT